MQYQQVPPGFTPPDPMMAFMQMMNNQMQQFMASIVAQHSFSPPSQHVEAFMHHAKLDERCSRRLDKFTNKKDGWKEWRMHFLTSVGECDPS